MDFQYSEMGNRIKIRRKELRMVIVNNCVGVTLKYY